MHKLSLAISNIAWPSEALEEALELVVRENLGGGIEIAPYSLFGTWEISKVQIAELRAILRDKGINCVALQGILYGIRGASLFDSDASRRIMSDHLQVIAKLAEGLGAKACVYGAPRSRDVGSLKFAKAKDVALHFFRSVGPIFSDHGAAIAFEANAQCYGCNFVTNTKDAIDLVEEIAEPGVRLQIDTGTIFLERENPAILERAAHFAAHAHISEPDLATIGSSGVDHRPVAAALRNSVYSGIVSIEMKQSPAWKDSCMSAIRFVQSLYGNESL